jgi:hypothetical protein
VTKGSGGNGINAVYQVGTQGVLPTGDTAALASTPITILPGFPTTLAGGVAPNGTVTPVAFPFGIWFANASTLYVCDEGDGTLLTPAVNGNVADAATLATAGVQKWSLVNSTWKMDYVLQNGLNIGVPYSVPNLPSAFNPATDGSRNITGKVNFDGTVSIYAVTSTVSASGDQGADPNKLVRVKDVLKATTLPTSENNHDLDAVGTFVTLRSAKAVRCFAASRFHRPYSATAERITRRTQSSIHPDRCEFSAGPFGNFARPKGSFLIARRRRCHRRCQRRPRRLQRPATRAQLRPS